MSTLTAARYGKDLVRVFRIVKDNGVHTVAEYNVRALLEGDLETSYTQADNSVVVATDSIKNIIYWLAKTSIHVLHPELFAIEIATYFVTKYPHIHKAFVDIEKLKWSRIVVDGKPHPHSFTRDGDEKVIVNVEVDATKGKDALVATVKSGIKELLVLKSTGSAFENFLKDEHTTLVPVDDRIFSTSVDCSYDFPPFPVKKEEIGTLEGKLKFVDAAASVVKNTLEVFATDESASVQATVYKMSQKIIAENPSIHSISYKLPNKHYIPVNMAYIGIENMKPSEAEVFGPVAAPSGYITSTVTRTA
ncbi:uricase [Sistotremastrum niveocremeum HHB9708]|uniref:Uricase n=2 Tax=Sistotremastraceae TaxID=3402574 RepID=A0A164TQS5_9AGAM|nr:uricase [Sistotremastrum niveocremeum HHB9708]KZT42231.1 uricase [Sistotremastrum suecicum HHB10207 ss-3]